MKLKLPKSNSRTGRHQYDNAIHVRQLRDAGKILAYLETQRGYCASAIAHLEPGFSDISNWFVGTHGDAFALCLISKSMSPTYVFTLGDSTALDYTLDFARLPGHAFITCQPQHLETIEGFYDIGWRCVMKHMMATRDSFHPAPQAATRLHPGHLREINRLYRLHGQSTFSAGQIKYGVYYGIWRGEELAAVAGTHVISPRYGIAYVGNVLTHPTFRNQGLATICTSAVTDDLLDYCTEVVLNVEPQNLPAIRAYANLGYQDHCMIVQAFGHRRSFVSDIITNLTTKLGLGRKYTPEVEANE